MNRNSAGAIVLGLGIIVGMASNANADDINQKTVFTFSGPVEIPGQVLDAGTYVFKLADSMSDRNIVQVFNKNENHLYGTFLTIPDYRLKPAGKTILTFDERAAGDPEAVRAWFYPGEDYGHDFVYPKARAKVLAKVNNRPVASMPTELAANTTAPTQSVQEPQVVAMKQAPLKAQQPAEGEVEISQVFLAPPPTEVAASARKTALPKTASPVPLVGLLGLLSLVGAGLLRRASAQ